MIRPEARPEAGHRRCEVAQRAAGDHVGILQAPDVSTFVQKHLHITVTGRNWNTVTKLSALLDG
jgi:hypothetical protein